MAENDLKGFRFRESTRAPFETEVRLRFDRFGGEVKAFCADLSMEGMFVRTTEPKPIGTLVQFEFTLGDRHDVIQGLGDVVWIRTTQKASDKPPGMGVQFRYVDPHSRELIFSIVDQYLKESQPAPTVADPSPVATMVHPQPTASAPASGAGGLSASEPSATESGSEAPGRPDLGAPGLGAEGLDAAGLNAGAPGSADSPSSLAPGLNIPTSEVPAAEVPLAGDVLAGAPQEDLGVAPDDAGVGELSFEPLETAATGSGGGVGPAGSDVTADEAAFHLDSIGGSTPSPTADAHAADTILATDPLTLSGEETAPETGELGSAAPALGALGTPEVAEPALDLDLSDDAPPPAPLDLSSLSLDDASASTPEAAADVASLEDEISSRDSEAFAAGSELGESFGEERSSASEPAPPLALDEFTATYAENAESSPRTTILLAVVFSLVLAFAVWYFWDALAGLFGGGEASSPAVAQLADPEDASAPAPINGPGVGSESSAAEVPDPGSADAAVGSAPAPSQRLDDESLAEEPDRTGALEPEARLPSERPATGLTPQPEVTTPAEPRASVLEPVAGESTDTGRAARQILAMAAVRDGSDTVVTIQADGDLSGYLSSQLAAPPRFLVRLPGITADFEARVAEGAHVARVRTGLHDRATGSELHLVFDLVSDGVRASVERGVNSLRVRFGS